MLIIILVILLLLFAGGGYYIGPGMGYRGEGGIDLIIFLVILYPHLGEVARDCKVCGFRPTWAWTILTHPHLVVAKLPEKDPFTRLL